MGRNISKNISSKQNQKLLDHTKHSASDAHKTSSKRVIQKTEQVTGDLTVNKIADKIARVAITSSQNNLETNEDIFQHYKHRKRNSVEINDESKGRYDNINIRFKTSIIGSNLCDYSDAYILVKGTITVLNNTNKKVILKNCAPFTDCITEINNIQVHDAKKIDVVMSIYNLIEYSDAYSKTSGSL